MTNLPSGTVTFLFTDIEGSTKLAQEHPDEMPALLTRHHEILNQAIQAHNGHVFQVVGDSFSASFHSAKDALNAAMDAQHVLQNEAWAPAPIKVRMGIHTGTAQLNADNQYSGYATLATTQRIMSAGHGGQVLLSKIARELTGNGLPKDTELVNLGEKRLKDLLRPERLYQLNISGLTSTFPPLKTLDTFPNNLPVHLTSFIGRENEIDEVKQKLEEHRLVTLTGSGGTGKTRLSLQVAADLLENFDHGVWLVELAPLTDPDLIPQTILSVMGVNEPQGRSSIGLLKEYLHNKEILIVLDNCEHLVSASAQVVNILLKDAPKLKILASSRESLGVEGELSYPVPSLTLPDIKHLPDTDGLSQYEAVRLFIDRAILVSPNFKVDNETASFIAQICHRLDGIPLALELAAARVKVLSVEQISRRLDDRFHLLTGGARTSLPRQQTLRALIDWSYDILDENERLLLRRLSVFAGGWSLEGAEEVCAGDEIELYDVLDLLSQLVNKSLVVVVEKSKDGETRYRLLETIRQYAREKLLESGSVEDLRSKYFEYYFQNVMRARSDFNSPKELSWLIWFENEWDNLHSVVEWSLEMNPEAGLEIVNTLCHFLLDNWHVSDMENWLSKLLSHPKNSDRSIPRAHGLINRGHSIFMGSSNENISLAQTLMREGISISEEFGDKNSIAWGLVVMGSRNAWLGDPNDGGPMLMDALAIARKTGEKPVLAHTLRFLAHSLPSHEAAQKNIFLQESLSIYRELGYISGMVEVLKQLGAAELRLGHFEAAHTYLDEALTILEKHSKSLGKSKTISFDIGDLAYYEGNYEAAKKYYEESLLWAENVVSTVSLGYAKVRLGYLHLRLEDENSAIRFFQESLLCFQHAGAIHGVTLTIEGIASLAVFKRQWKKAALLLAYATRQYELLHGPRPPVEQTSVEKDLTAICSQINSAEFTQLSSEGSTMTTEQAIALAFEN